MGVARDSLHTLAARFYYQKIAKTKGKICHTNTCTVVMLLFGVMVSTRQTLQHSQQQWQKQQCWVSFVCICTRVLHSCSSRTPPQEKPHLLPDLDRNYRAVLLVARYVNVTHSTASQPVLDVQDAVLPNVGGTVYPPTLPVLEAEEFSNGPGSHLLHYTSPRRRRQRRCTVRRRCSR